MFIEETKRNRPACVEKIELDKKHFSIKMNLHYTARRILHHWVVPVLTNLINLLTRAAALALALSRHNSKVWQQQQGWYCM